MNEPLLVLLRVNLALAGAVVVVLALRVPVRRLFGARVAYGLWSLVPLAALAMLLPARVMTVAVPSAPADGVIQAGGSFATPMLATPQAPDIVPGLMLVWLVGAIASLAWLAWRQAQFARAVREGHAGPAVIGVLRPRIVTPDDFDRRYTPREQLVVLAHEQTHIARHDSQINALAALARCLNWFNPAAHLLTHALRIDQELACDAQVVAAHPQARRPYAEAMLKTQLAARPLPLGCYWPAPAVHPLAQRVALLGRKAPGRTRRAAGVLAIAAAGLAGAGATWLARPPQIVLTPVAATASVAPLEVAAISGSVQTALLRVERPAKPPAPAASPAPPSEQPAAPPEPMVERVPDTLPPPMEVRRIRAAALRSAVEPGSAVRVVATMTDPDGVPLITDLTAYGSQSAFRTGYFRRNGSRYQLFTSVIQRDDRLWITASLDNRFLPERSGTIELGPNETGAIVLPNGQTVTVTPSLRAETPQEIADAEWAMARYADPRRLGVEVRSPL